MVASRRSIPKLQVFNTALITAQFGMNWHHEIEDGKMPGRLVESAVGAHLLNATVGKGMKLFYWRENNREVDFVLRQGKKIVAIEVKSGRAPSSFPGLDDFVKRFNPTRTLMVGEACPHL